MRPSQTRPHPVLSPATARLVAACVAPPLAAAPLVTVPVALHAQPAGARGTLTGTVVAAIAGQPVATASVAVRGGGSGGPADTAFYGGGTVRSDGTFRVEGLRPGRYAVRVRALGFVPLVRNVTVLDAGGVVDLGRLALAAAAVQLGAVTVQGEQAQAALAPDRNTYQTKDMPAASGGTAIDVLRNVPQVGVDADNNVSLRGNANVTVQINGRPTPLKGQQLGNYLAQLPANLVAKVDVITNPSAKNDPDGAAGIVNITLTQRPDLGTSGGLQAATSTTGLFTVNGNVGRQQGPWTGFASYGFFRDDRASTGTADQVNAGGGAPASLASTTAGRLRPQFQSATLRGEYQLTAHDALAGDVVFNTGAFARTLDAAYVATDPAGVITTRYAQSTAPRFSNTTGDYALAWRHTGQTSHADQTGRTSAPEQNTLSVELRLNDAQNGFRSVIGAPAYALGGPPPGAASLGGGATRTDNSTSGRTPTWRLQGDLTRVLGTDTKLEAGVLGIERRTASAFGTAMDSGAGYVDVPGLGNAFTYHEHVGSAYGVLTHKAGPWQLQGGLRLERATTHFHLAAPEGNTGGMAAGAGAAPRPQRFTNAYTSAFPSALVAYTVDPQQQLKVSYSRRVTRPDPQQLNPFVARLDAYTMLQGNPALRPEYTDSYEVGYQHAFAKGSLQLTPYYRRTPRAVRLIQTVDTTGVTRFGFANVALSTSYGTDLNATLRLGPFTLLGGGSVFGVSTDAHNVTPDVSFRGTGWTAQGTGTYRLTPLVDLQASASYRAPTATEGGRRTAYAMSTVALKRKLQGDQASLTLSAQDPFNTAAFGLRTVNGPLVQTSDQHYGVRSLRLSYNYRFGKAPQLRPRREDAPSPQAPGGGAGPPG